MVDDVRLQGPVRVQSDAATRVAFDLMNRVAEYDQRVKADGRDAKYWLTLYTKCLKAATGSSLEEVLRVE
jgi:hypothetical protein